jgi:ribosomal protein L35
MFSKRLKVTKNGKIKARRPGINHFNAKESRSSQLNCKVAKDFTMSHKSVARFLPGLVK